MIHTFEQKSSWIHPPAGATISISQNGTDFTSIEAAAEIKTDDRKRVDLLKFSLPPTAARYIKVLIKNAGTIPAGNAGAGNKAWLFVDEIEVE